MMKYKAIGCLTFISSFAAAATSMPELLPRYPCFQEFELHQESHLIPNTFQIMRAACKGSVIDDPGPDVKNVAIKTVLFSGGSFSIDEKADPNWILTFTPDLQCKAENQVGETIETLVGGVHTKVEIHYGKPRRARILSAKGPTVFQNPVQPGAPGLINLGTEDYFGFKCQHYQLDDLRHAQGYRSEFCQIPLPPSKACPASGVLPSLTALYLSPGDKSGVEVRVTYFNAGVVGTVFGQTGSRIVSP